MNNDAEELKNLKVPETLHRMAKAAAALRGEKLGEFVIKTLTPVIVDALCRNERERGSGAEHIQE
jgi:hypothetical protein